MEKLPKRASLLDEKTGRGLFMAQQISNRLSFILAGNSPTVVRSLYVESRVVLAEGGMFYELDIAATTGPEELLTALHQFAISFMRIQVIREKLTRKGGKKQ